jgi:carbon-monoxide dehydrogenase catalytic subunit
MAKDIIIDEASCEIIKKAAEEGVEIVFDRAEKIKPCPIGAVGQCCKNCMMGPCRLVGKDAEQKQGVCGASLGVIAARNLARMIAAGTSCHGDHGRDMAFTLLAAAKGEAPGYEVKDVDKLHKVAGWLDIKTEGRDKNEIAIDIANACINMYTQQHGELPFIKRAPKKRQEKWKEHGVIPRGIDREVVEMMNRTNIGMDQDVENIMMQGFRCALANGWGGSMIATELQDILFGTPKPIRGKVNLGVLKEDEVNIVLHGHEPTLSEMIVAVSMDPEIIAYAKSKGANGVNLSGICCTANEVLMRHGIPSAGNFLQQELAVITGAVEAMVVDVQCIMSSLPKVASCFHTKIVTTSDKAKITGAEHIHFDEHDAIESAKKIIRLAIDNFPNRGNKVNIPKMETHDMVVGFTDETITHMLGGTYRGSYRPLNDAIIAGRIRGVVGIVGCNNPKVAVDDVHIKLAKELIKNDVLVVVSGCSGITNAKAGLLVPEAKDLAGPGLKEICETVGIPPVLHVGSCVDNTRILIACTQMVNEGGLGDDIPDLPVVGVAPGWMSEKAISIGHYTVGSGLLTIFGVTFPVTGSEEMSNMVFNRYEELFGGKFAFESDPLKIAEMCIEHIDNKRKALGIDKVQERVLFDMEKRRELGK